ncbi:MULTISPECIES: nucleoside triphosphate pyrophosphohydrolase [Aphanizomenon]|uniref:Nucleoside triphosphate pyrophosphohydrolase n=1 Tax=Aphanizomenon flos-aquae FACHB-1249 TaxID=2692889 RepID=A0ABR8IX17_APHFL|nr:MULTISPECIES: nucleoside triphosphate pyrophosphohydrolase [Aphanizomenon]MBD2389354.1 nucleoside triphosphate pyrophosphohydrolase [Aphanizomenon flos-aquae FACHB-1171]MBD2557688.1 nucleoside triphosphate pyrophosphohydrolase [Aphanizomenon flos-aquae FACHB-1290]MBD2632580.1 nucleoside triphosphate pyrophosphohydrolase [Aphanizomenon sp. FACHB-1399]MBD2644120.1 nucleoside triphosphate pyrophosphohydrolase [Aphanizomenon sp. FACHB-1401]MBD2656414.1 nucleoside triphosphate pyrophosphohydrola
MEVNQTLAALQELINVVAKLRFLRSASLSTEGCPWDLAQTPSSLTPYVIEEAYEVVDAIQTGDKQAIAEQLGDLLLQVVLQAQIASEAGDFSLQEVTEGIAKKLIRRHPHVFADVNAVSMEEVQKNWETIKAAEKGETLEEQKLSDKLNRYRRSLPPLNAAMKISEKAAKVGLEWNNVEEVWGKFHEELGEFQQALAEETKERQESELGDLLFAIIQVARWHKLDPSAGLQGTSQRFIQRLQKIETMIERPLTDYSLEELDALWQQAKAQLANRNV